MHHLFKARDLMEQRVITLSPTTNVVVGLQKLLQNRISGAPVVNAEGRYLGVFSEKCCLSWLTLAAAFASEKGMPAECSPPVEDFMVRQVFSLQATSDVMDGIHLLLKRAISGAPVFDESGRYAGVFSEKTCMSVLIGASYDQLPSTSVGAYLNADPDRLICSSTNLWSAAGLFISARFRRLVVMDGERVIGLVTRRGLLQASLPLLGFMPGEDHQATTKYRGWGTPCLRYRAEGLATFMDVNAPTITPDTDLLTIAQIFRSTNYRRLPVVIDGHVVGLVSRKNVLNAAFDSLEGQRPSRPEVKPLHLSAL